MRRLLGRTAAVVAALLAVAPVTPLAHADTGGDTVYYTYYKHAGHGTLRAPADRPGATTPVATPAGETWVERVVPSPDGAFIALAELDLDRNPVVFRVVVADASGRHRHVAWRTADSANSEAFDSGGITWSHSGRRIYFGIITSHLRMGPPLIERQLFTARVAHGVPQPATAVPGGTGLSWPTADPSGSDLAAIRVTERTKACQNYSYQAKAETYSVVRIDPHSGATRTLYSIAQGRPCRLQLREPAWSPDGKRIAFANRYLCDCGRQFGAIEVLRADTRRPTPVVAASGHGNRLLQSPAWQDSHALWFTKEMTGNGNDVSKHILPDLYRVTLHHGRYSAPVRRTHTPHRGEQTPSFG